MANTLESKFLLNQVVRILSNVRRDILDNLDSYDQMEIDAVTISKIISRAVKEGDLYLISLGMVKTAWDVPSIRAKIKDAMFSEGINQAEILDEYILLSDAANDLRGVTTLTGLNTIASSIRGVVIKHDRLF